MAVQLKSMRMDQILDRYRQAESQLPALLRWTRLGVLHERALLGGARGGTECGAERHGERDAHPRAQEG